MSLLAWVELISAALKFPDAVMRLINALRKTPQEQHEALIQASEAEALKWNKTGRPSWP